MAQTTLKAPAHNRLGLNTSDAPVEHSGDGLKTIIDTLNTMLAELYTGLATPPTDPLTTIGVGAAAGTGVVASESGNGTLHKTTLTFTNVALALVDEAGVVAYKGLKVYDFPEGFISFQGALANLAVTKSSAGVVAAFDGDFALGTATAGNDGALSSTEANLMPSTATPQAVAGATTATGVSTGTEAPKILDGHTTALDAFINFLVDDADHDVTTTPCNLILNGTVTLLWSNLGDY